MIRPVLRPATSDDLTALLAIEVECFGTAAWGAPSLDSAIADPDQDVVVTTSGDAYGVLRTVDHTADLDRIAAVPQVRRRGVGRGVLDHLFAHAERRGARRIMLEVAADNTAALRLYAAAGFAEIHRRSRYYPGGVDAVVMERRLADQPPRARLDA
jgi:ribosomal protein S18 acetylase RimI-like enzyme